jgi:hypothetical protein
LVEVFLAKNNVTTLQHYPYPPDLAAAVTPTEISIEGAATDIIKKCEERAEKASKMSYRNVSNTFIVAGRSVYLYKGIILKELNSFIFTVNKVIPGTR